ncbi:hypothetical protein BKA83DRAFT_4187499 [Pisolithus microcarpus]|nr:hypothetical protein BKA83DRAFT_4187499 [Pisolithus microcarpus]
MTAQEREWWSSPYLRMLSSPIRWCAISRRHMPSDFLIRLTPLQLPPLQIWMPDGLQHPKFRRRNGQLALYMTCWKDIFSPINLSRTVPSRVAPKGIFHKLLATQIGHSLRLRIIQELQLLEERLSHEAATILRRLTRAEFKDLRKTGAVPHQDAIAVMVVPPVNRIIPHASYSHLQGSITSINATTRRNIRFRSLVPAARVPLYNGLTIMTALCKILGAERRSRLGRSPNGSDGNQPRRSISSSERGSHAFLLISNERTAKRADSAALAIALWRLRMWEGDAYQDQVCSGGWEVDGEWRMNYLRQSV